MFEGGDQSGMSPLPEYDEGSGKSFFQRIFSKSETMIPIILIIILIVILALAFSGWDYTSIPIIGGTLQDLFGSKTYNVLVIGQPHPVTVQKILGGDDFKPTYKFSIRDEEALKYSPETVLSNYDFVILDQSDSSTKMGYDKTIPYKLAEALKNYVASGKSIIIVGNSAHSIAGSPDAYGWVAVFGDISPMDCTQNIGYQSPCEQPLMVHGILINTEANTKIFYGIDQVPSIAYQQQGSTGLDFTLYNVNTHNSYDLMYIKDTIKPASYPGISVNKSMLGGKVVYFSYEQLGYTPDLVKRVFKYIR